jgi:ElaB/YqjD/DUF883 family membrane-anchored ribosome-binding protein
MSHKPQDTTVVDTTPSADKPRIVSVAPPEEEKIEPAPVNKLRMAETSSTTEETKNQAQTIDFSENMTANAGNIDKIRDILFGGQMRDYDKRFKRLEERFAQESGHFRDDMLQRLKILEDKIDDETDNLGEKSKLERQERQNAHQDLTQEIATLKNELNVRLSQLDEQIGRDIKNLRQQTHSKFQELSLQLRQQSDSLTTLIQQEVAQLQEEKVNRSELAVLFNDLTLRFSKNFEPPATSE